MLNKFFGFSAVAAAALLVGATSTLAHDGRDDLCGGVMESDEDMVLTSSGKPLLLGSSAPCPQQTAAVETETETATETAEAVPASLPHDGMVYFGLDSDQLDAEDQAMLDEIIAAVKDGGPAKIVVRGHADRSGGEDYNMSLSERRAETIAAALIAAGIPADSVRTMGRGETDPAVATDDGVAMRQNRRAAIQSDE
jgi:outer membrane protein OmpA-like peptidoglycan-associated protein